MNSDDPRSEIEDKSNQLGRRNPEDLGNAFRDIHSCINQHTPPHPLRKWLLLASNSVSKFSLWAKRHIRRVAPAVYNWYIESVHPYRWLKLDPVEEVNDSYARGRERGYYRYSSEERVFVREVRTNFQQFVLLAVVLNAGWLVCILPAYVTMIGMDRGTIAPAIVHTGVGRSMLELARFGTLLGLVAGICAAIQIPNVKRMLRIIRREHGPQC